MALQLIIFAAMKKHVLRRDASLISSSASLMSYESYRSRFHPVDIRSTCQYEYQYLVKLMSLTSKSKNDYGPEQRTKNHAYSTHVQKSTGMTFPHACA